MLGWETGMGQGWVHVNQQLSRLIYFKKHKYIAISMISQHHDHHNDVITTTMSSQITSLTIVYSTFYSGADQRKHQSSVSLAFVRGIHRGPVNFPHKRPVTRKMFPFDDVIMDGTDRWKLSSWKAMARFSHIINITAARDLATQGVMELFLMKFLIRH